MSTDQDSKVCIVGIGASAGGIEALRKFFQETPPDTGLAFVVIQHLDPSQPSQMTSILSKSTRMSVVETEDDAMVEQNHVYTLPPGKFVSTREGRLHLHEAVKSDGLRLPIDFFFRSLAEDQREAAIAVLLSGGGSDGTLGIREVHAAGGLVLVQDPKSAQFDSMITHALATGMVDLALPVKEIPATLIRFRDQNLALESKSPGATIRDGIASIVDLLASQTNGDFHGYKPAMLHRRIQRRMGLNQIDEMADYYKFLTEQPEEVAKLFQDLLIGVTSFFRDPPAFDELRAKVIGPLIREKNVADPLRVWIAGCSTGEEAYSIVILIKEAMVQARKSFRLQIFASDIDAAGLKRGRDGYYPASIAADVSEERLARFFIKQDGFYRIDKEVREAVTFANHNLLLDPPFFNMDLISCRNLLIYIEPPMQKLILDRFAFALRPGRYLFLGRFEDPSEQSEAFQQISRDYRIFRRTVSIGPLVGRFLVPSERRPAHAPSTKDKESETTLASLNQQVLLRHFNTSIVLVDENGEVRHFFGPTHRYLAHSTGKASLTLFDMVDNRHSPMLRLSLERAVQQRETLRLAPLEIGSGAALEWVSITITPTTADGSQPSLFAVIFEDGQKSPSTDARQSSAIQIEGSTLEARLETENQALRAEIQASVDAFQAMHEELTAAHEEGMAINEELQSTNEELLTSQEELQSLNEEMVTSNSQLSEKVDELGRVNDDLSNFLNSSDVITIFLDRKFCVRRFTPSVTRLINLLPLDQGRPIDHIAHKIIDVDLTAIAQRVLDSLIPMEKEVRDAENRWYLLRCLPYRSINNVIDGIVFTFSDVTQLKRSEEAIRHARDYAENIIETSTGALLVLDRQLKIVSANRAFYEIFGVTRTETENHLIYDVGNGQWNIPKLRELLEEIMPTNSEVKDFYVKHDFPRLGNKVMSVNARKIRRRGESEPELILLAITDVTHIDTRARLAALVESSQDAIVGLALDGTITSWNRGAERIFDYRADEMIGESIMRIVPPGREQEEEKRILERLRRGESVEHFETLRLGRDMRQIYVSLTISPIRNDKGVIVGASKVARDITERKRLEQQRLELSRELEKQVFERTAELREANRKLLEDMSERERLEEQLRQSHKLESMGILAAGIAHDLNNLLNIIQGYASILGPGATRDDISDSVDAITQTTKRGAMLVQQLLALARKTETKMELLEVNGLIEQLSALIKGSFPKNIETRLDLSTSPLTIMGDASQINQVLLNLCVNARDAMPDGGPLVIKTLTVDAKDLEAHGEFASAKFAAIEVIDGGVGIDEKTQEKIFDPFFTTKAVGQGTGLGLAVVYGIVKSHGGFIHVESQPGHGTTFTLYFPIASTGG